MILRKISSNFSKSGEKTEREGRKRAQKKELVRKEGMIMPFSSISAGKIKLA